MEGTTNLNIIFLEKDFNDLKRKKEQLSEKLNKDINWRDFIIYLADKVED